MDEVEVRVDRLPAAERLTLASLSGVAARYGWGTMRNAPRAEALDELHAVSSDPRLLGIVCGHALADEHSMQLGAVELLRAAGADMGVAELAAAELRARRDRQQTGHRGD